MAHGIDGDENFSLNGGAVRFQKLGNCAQSFHPHETFSSLSSLYMQRFYFFYVSSYLISIKLL